MIRFTVIFLSITSLLSLYRVIFGPTIQDRLVGLNLIATKTTVVMVLLAVLWDQKIFLDVALVYAILGYVGIIAITKYPRKG
ncbi:multiple resistance and pH regulation protein F [Candidatus Vecturithrix granuli]|uniref:Multiple resistance and pH regulation protein F n=1 Tax=Vecturithrix granuli TaxID=1499967 RepID=A0A081BUC8_VECG1|nr:multiple resistance and pH regulation protein F [Candidatus Vecturithrix granuli]